MYLQMIDSMTSSAPPPIDSNRMSLKTTTEPNIKNKCINKIRIETGTLTHAPVHPADKDVISKAHPSPELQARVGDVTRQATSLQLRHGSELRDVIAGD